MAEKVPLRTLPGHTRLKVVRARQKGRYVLETIPTEQGVHACKAELHKAADSIYEA